MFPCWKQTSPLKHTAWKMIPLRSELPGSHSPLEVYPAEILDIHESSVQEIDVFFMMPGTLPEDSTSFVSPECSCPGISINLPKTKVYQIMECLWRYFLDMYSQWAFLNMLSLEFEDYMTLLTWHIFDCPSIDHSHKIITGFLGCILSLFSRDYHGIIRHHPGNRELNYVITPKGSE